MHQRRRAYSYTVVTPPSNLAVSLVTFKAFIKQPNLPASQDALITILIESATESGEKLTRRDFITREYVTFRDFFPEPSQNEGYYAFGQVPAFTGITGDENVGFELRKSPLQSVEQVQYLKSGSFVIIPSTDYYNTVETDYSELLSANAWPTDNDNRLQSIEINFKTGFGDTEADIPSDIKNAILMHATALWSDRGDCCEESNMPALAKSIYLKNRIENL